MSCRTLKKNLRAAGFDLAARHLEHTELPCTRVDRGGIVVHLDRTSDGLVATLDDGTVVADERRHYLERTSSKPGPIASGVAMKHCSIRLPMTDWKALVDNHEAPSTVVRRLVSEYVASLDS